MFKQRWYFTCSPRSFESFRAIVATKSPWFPRDEVAFILVEPNCFQAYFIAGKKVQLCKKLRKKVFPLCSINCYTLTINRNKVEKFVTLCQMDMVFANHRKSLIQHCERSKLRLHFWENKTIKNAQNAAFWLDIHYLKLAVKQCYQTGQFW